MTAQNNGRLKITSFPTGATVEINGTAEGNTTYSAEVPAGTYIITVSYKGFEPESRTITVLSGQETSYDFILKEKPSVTIWNIQGTLYIDGVPTTYDLSNLSYVIEGQEGDTHEIRIEPDKSKYLPYKHKFTLSNRAQNINPLYTRNKLKKNEFYAEFGCVLNSGAGIVITAGYNWGLLNIEASYAYSFLEDYIFVTTYRSGEFNSISSRIEAGSSYSIKAGANFMVGSRIKITPQAGIRHLGVSMNAPMLLRSYCLNGLAGLRLHFAILPYLGISISPSYCFPLVQGELFRELAEYGTSLGKLKSGVDIRTSLVVNF